MDDIAYLANLSLVPKEPTMGGGEGDMTRSIINIMGELRDDSPRPRLDDGV